MPDWNLLFLQQAPYWTAILCPPLKKEKFKKYDIGFVSKSAESKYILNCGKQARKLLGM